MGYYDQRGKEMMGREDSMDQPYAEWGRVNPEKSFGKLMNTNLYL